MTQPQQQFTELATDPNFTVNPQAGPVWEHWGLNVTNVHLAKPEVREALAHALKKQQVVETLYTPLFGDLLPVEGLGNAFWMSNQPDYENHQGDAGYGTGDVEAAKALLEGAGYVLGADGVYEHPTDGRLSLRNGTTGGNQLRELQQQLIQAQMLEAGIEIVIENLPGSEYFSIPFGGDPTVWEITQFAWVGGPWPGGATASFRTGSGNNPYGYASPDFDAKATECETTVDETAAATCWNELDQFVTTLGPDGLGLVVLPLTQKPSFYAYSNTALAAGAIAPDADSAGPLVNVVDFKPAP
jgi:peptide/nickel transport system substrate-binding protein